MLLLEENQRSFTFRFKAKVYIDMKAFMKKVVSDFYSINTQTLEISWAQYRFWITDFKENGICFSGAWNGRFFPMPPYVYFID